MTPVEARRCENFDSVRNQQKMYATEFDKYKRKNEVFVNGTKVLIKNEQKKTKMDKVFDESGVVVRNLYGDVYEVKNSRNKVIVRHVSQLKGIGEGGCNCIKRNKLKTRIY